MDETTRSEALLALILLNLLGRKSNRVKARYLHLAGFTPLEIANILELYTWEVVGYLGKQSSNLARKEERHG